MKKILFSLSVLLMLCAVSCGGANNSVNNEPSQNQDPVSTPEPEPENKVSVIVMSGQSNMEGSTYYDNGQKWLKKALEKAEIYDEPFFSGINEVQCSFRGYYPYGGGNPGATCHASNMEDRMKGKFLPVKVGMGNSEVDIGPEIGLANVVRVRATEEKPIFLIKSAFSGSGFDKTGYNWKVEKDGGEVLWDETKTFINNNLQNIRDLGFEPEIKAWLWHQGESDSNNEQQATDYLGYMRNLLQEFRDEYAPVAPQKNGENIAFVDCTIYDGTRLTYSAVDTLNATKKTLSEESNMNFIINASTKDPNGLGLEIGGNGDIGGCRNIYHYTTEDMFKLGCAYGNILMDNDII